VRAAAAVGLPGAALVAFGRPGDALFVTFGAFAVLYGEGRAYRVRARVVLTAAGALLLAAGLGAVVGRIVAGEAVAKAAAVVVVTVVAALAVYAVDALRLGPPGALFFTLVCGGALAAAESGVSPPTVLGCTALGGIASVVVSMAGVVADRGKPERQAVARAVHAVAAFLDAGGGSAEARHAAGSAVSAAWSAVHDAGLPARGPGAEPVSTLVAAHRRFAAAAGDAEPGPGADLPLPRPGVAYRLRRSATLRSHAMITTLRVVLVCVTAGGLSAVAGLDRPHWAILSALVVLQQGTDRIRANVRGLQRFAGTAVGLGLFAALFQLSPTGLALIATIAVLQFCIELFVPRNYAVAVVFITPVALLAGGAALTGPVGAVIRDRLVETVLGVVLATLSQYLVAPNAHRVTFAWTGARVRTAALALLGTAREQPVDRAATTGRRDLQFELEGSTRAAIDSAHNDLGWTRRHWPEHAALVHLGYDLLAACWATPPGATLADTDRWERAFRGVPL
jgi:hypothetical protein